MAELTVEFIPCKPSDFLIRLAELQVQQRDATSGSLAMMGGVPPGSPILGQEKLLCENAERRLRL